LRLNDFTEASLDLSTMSAAQRDLLPLDESPAETEAATPIALRDQVAQRLAAHRARRTQRAGAPVTPKAPPADASSRASRIAATVAERYAKSQSYRAFLAAQAETAIREAEAAAEVAALSAQAVADAQYKLLDELDQLSSSQASARLEAVAEPVADLHTADLHITDLRIVEDRTASPTTAQVPYSGLTVRLYETDQRSAQRSAGSAQGAAAGKLRPQSEADDEEVLALEDEIAFRQAPVFDEVGPSSDIPANLIQFPRQLVAPRKARPRLAEGPLREDSDHAHDSAQLRIFEVEAAQISSAPAIESAAPEWSSILLAAHPVSAVVEAPEAPFQPIPSPQTAPFNLRLMAAIVDGCVVAAALFAFAAVFAVTVGKLAAGSHANFHMAPQTAAITGLVVFGMLTLLYQFLFFSLAEATPGMRYARIGLCTLDDDNPTRAAMRRRIFATVLAACPLGIGFLWAWLDDDGLGWHDRISRMYQRSY
jgi:uncharacterized RDD family membrane protein YckC